MGGNDVKISLKMKNKGWLRKKIENKYCKMRKNGVGGLS